MTTGVSSASKILDVLLRRRKPTDPDDLSGLLASSEERCSVLLEVARSLVELAAGFTLDIEEIASQRFRGSVRELRERLVADEPGPLRSAFRQHDTSMHCYVVEQMRHLDERESELKGIIDLLTKAVVASGTGNETYHQKVYQRCESIEGINRLGEIRQIKAALQREVTELRKAVRHKEQEEKRQLHKLSKRVSFLDQELERAREAALEDGLTRVFNRRAFDLAMSENMGKLQRKGIAFSLLLLDIDDFKKFNDTYGHLTGDGVLVAVAARCTEKVRRKDIVARYGGEEFAVILPGASLRAALRRARSLCRDIATTKFVFDSEEAQCLRVTASIGVAQARLGDTPEDVLGRADAALYHAKRTGKDRVVSETEVPVGQPGSGSS